MAYTKGNTGCGNIDYGSSDFCPIEQFGSLTLQAAVAATPNLRFHLAYEAFEEAVSRYDIHYTVGGIGESHFDISVKYIALGASFSIYQDLRFLPAYTLGLSILKDIKRFHTTIIQENSRRIFDDRINAELLEVTAGVSAMFLEGIETGLSLKYEFPVGGGSNDSYREPSNDLSIELFVKAHMGQIAIGSSIDLDEDFVGTSVSFSYFF